MAALRAIQFQAGFVILLFGQALSAPAAAPAASSAPVQLPANPKATCTKEALRQATSNPSACGSVLYDSWSRKYTAGAPCCSRLFAAYGSKSTAPTRGCFCVPEIWQPFNAATNAGINFASLLDSCAKLNFTVPYYQNGTGLCAGKAAKAATTAAKSGGITAATASQPRSAGAWFAYLRHDWLLLVSFMSSLVAALGFLLIAWPFVHDFLFDLVRPVRSLASLHGKARRQKY